jgi:hypothetical protein
MTTRYLPHAENLLDALSYIKGCDARRALAHHFKRAFQSRDRTISDADVMEQADVHLAWHQRINQPDAIEIVAELGLYRCAVLVETTGFALAQPVGA